MKIIILINIISVLLLSCSGGLKSKKNPDCMITGWVNDDTYRVTGTGIPDIEMTSKSKRKDTARDNAVLNAKFKIENAFKKSGIDKKKFESRIKEGKIIFIEYDNYQNCEIIYEIKHKHLRKELR